MWAAWVCLLLTAGAGVELHVAVDGHDTAPGTAAAPLATLEAARDRLRAAPDPGRAGRPPGPATVWLHAGTYERRAPFVLGPADSGTADAPVVYRAWPGDAVSLSGGHALPADVWQPVTDPAVLARLDPAARGQVLVCDLRAAGVTDFGELHARGFRRPYVNPGLELFCNDQPLTLARWPNAGTVPLGKVLDPGSIPRNGDFGNRGGKFVYGGDRPDRWAGADDVYLSGLFNYGYADDTLKVKSVDPATKTITLAQATMYGLASGRPWQAFYALNLLAELDSPGEWYLDRPAGRLYVWPPVPLAQARLSVSLLDEPLVCLEGASWITLRDLTLELGRGLGVYIEGGRDCLLAGCTIRHCGTVGVCIGRGVEPDRIYRHEYPGGQLCARQLGSWHEAIYANSVLDRLAGTHHGVVGCDLYDLGAGGVSLGGGDRRTLTPAGNYVANCHIHHFNRLDRSYKAAVNLDGVGNSVRQCLIHDAPNNALYLHGNDHLLEGNEIHDTCTVADDMGSVYMGRDPSEQGNVIRGNFFHHNGSPHGATCVLYFDDGACGTQVLGNLFYANRASPTWINGGQGMRYEGNLLIDTRDLRIGTGWPAPRFAAEMKGALQTQRLRRLLDITVPPYSTRYPELPNVLAPADQLHRGQDVVGNVGWRCAGSFEAKGNRCRDNVMLTEDPGFVSVEAMDFRLLDPARLKAAAPGFVPLDVTRIGLQRDEYRRTLPPAPLVVLPASGDVPAGAGVRLVCRDAGVRFTYTLDGSAPGPASTAYTGPFPVARACRLRARAWTPDGAGAGDEVALALTPVVPRDPLRTTADGWLGAAQAKELHGIEVDALGQMGHIENGDWLSFGPFEFGPTPLAGLEIALAVDPKYAGGKLHVRLDTPTGPDRGLLVLKSTGGFREFVTRSVPVSGLSGAHTVYLTFEGGSGIANLQRLRFVAAAGGG